MAKTRDVIDPEYYGPDIFHSTMLSIIRPGERLYPLIFADRQTVIDLVYNRIAGPTALGGTPTVALYLMANDVTWAIGNATRVSSTINVGSTIPDVKERQKFTLLGEGTTGPSNKAIVVPEGSLLLLGLSANPTLDSTGAVIGSPLLTSIRRQYLQ